MGQHAQFGNVVGAARRLLLAGAFLALTVPAPAQACRLALAFALDVSASVDASEYRLQLNGLATALNAPGVRAAILAPGGGIALSAYEWSGQRQQVTIAPWTLITEATGLDAFTSLLTSHQRLYGEFPTAVGHALTYGLSLMDDAPRCQRRVIDISGDGLSNDGFGPLDAYRTLDFADITVNGMVIGGGDLELISFYKYAVIRGPEAFVEVAEDYEDYPRAMLRKLLREIGQDFTAEARP